MLKMYLFSNNQLEMVELKYTVAMLYYYLFDNRTKDIVLGID